MKKATRRLLAILLCLFAVCTAALPCHAVKGNEGTTIVSLQQLVTITDQTADFATPVGSDALIKVEALGNQLTYCWQVSTDGGQTYGGIIGTEAAYQIRNACKNNPNTMPYFYRVTVSDSFGSTAAAIIRVLVHNDYAYRTITDERTGLSVNACMHKNTGLTVTPQGEASPGYSALAACVDQNGKSLPFEAYEIALTNADPQWLPYLGEINIGFPLSQAMNGQALRVYHQAEGSAQAPVDTLEGTVAGGSLPITARSLGMFLIEVPSSCLHVIQGVAGPGGAISPSGEVRLLQGRSLRFVFLPDIGYIIRSVLVDDVPVSVTGNSYTFENINASHQITVNFKDCSIFNQACTITVRGGKGGGITPSGTVSVTKGASRTFYFYPDPGYQVKAVLVNGVEMAVFANRYTFSSVQENSTIEVLFEKQPAPQPAVIRHTVTVTATQGGTVSPSGAVSVAHGGDLYLYIQPDAGYAIESVTVNGQRVSIKDNYQLINITEDQTVQVAFQPIKSAETTPAPQEVAHYTLTVEQPPNGGGAISPEGTLSLPTGGSQTLYFYPDEGHVLTGIYINGEKIDVVANSYTIQNIQGNITVSASFEAIVQTGTVACGCWFCASLGALFRFSFCICPWCWVTPLILVAALVALCVILIKRKT